MNGAPGILTPGISSQTAPPACLLPLGAEGLVEDVAQVAEARKGEGEAVVARDHVQDVDDQQVAGLRVLYVDRAGQGMHQVEIEAQQVVEGGVPRNQRVAAVARLHKHFVARLDGENGRNVGMPAVVAGPRLVGERPGKVNAYLMGCHLGLHPMLR